MAAAWENDAAEPVHAHRGLSSSDVWVKEAYPSVQLVPDSYIELSVASTQKSHESIYTIPRPTCPLPVIWTWHTTVMEPPCVSPACILTWMNKRTLNPVMGVYPGTRMDLKWKHPKFICSINAVLNIWSGRINMVFFLGRWNTYIIKWMVN